MMNTWKSMFSYFSTIAASRLSIETHPVLQIEELEQRYLLSTFTVINTDDSGAGSFRQAIVDANETTGLDRIKFTIGSGHQVIQPLSALPEITDPVVINATTQPGYADQPLIELDGSQAGSLFHGLLITAGDSKVRGLVINDFGKSGIFLMDGGNNRISGNYIGTDFTGTLDEGNVLHGIMISNSANNVIGGATAGTGNLISGNDINGVALVNNSQNNTIAGNLIGSDASGTQALGNYRSGLSIHNSPSNIVGGTTTNARNLISGNAMYGVFIAETLSHDNLVVGNYIGTDLSGSEKLGNGRTGLLIQNADANTIGGLTADAANVISGNGHNGVNFDGTRLSVAQGVPTGYAKNNRVLGNLIGTDASGTKALGNAWRGVQLFHAPNNIIGGTSVSARNIISGNQRDGVMILGVGAFGNMVSGNYIGTDITGSVAFGNSPNGVLIWDASANTIGGTDSGSGNVISGSAKYGVEIRGVTSTGNAVLGNAIFDNEETGIDLGNNGATANDPGDADEGANHLQNYPELTTAEKLHDDDLRITYKVDSFIGNSTYPLRVEFFLADASGQQGQTFLGADTYFDSEATAEKTVTFTPAASVLIATHIVATATDDNGNTSEFSLSREVTPPIITVTNTADDGAGSLREAIISANAALGIDRIEFAIDSGQQTIQLLSALPKITDPIVIDGMTQPGFAGQPLIELDGSLAGEVVTGLYITAGNSLVRGLVINNWDGQGIILAGQGSNRIAGNYLGSDFAGTIEQPNSGNGIRIISSANNVIGGTDALSWNLISGNGRFGVSISGASATGNSLAGNLIGTDAGGSQALGNSFGGVLIYDAPANSIGGQTQSARNVISGNGYRGVWITRSNATGNQVAGNFIGTDITGSSAIGNHGFGVSISQAPANTIGGTTADSGNVISGNDRYGISITGINSAANLVAGNLIGTDASAANSLGNGISGILIYGAPANTIGGASANLANVISGNDGYGVMISGASATDNVIAGNYIGTQQDGTTELGNANHGVLLSNVNSNAIGGTAAGLGNTIAFNGGNGVFISGTSIGNPVLGNLFFSNVRLGIDLGTYGFTANDAGDADAGANNLQNSPELITATKLLNGDLEITYQVDSSIGNSAYPLRIEFYLADSSGAEGKTYLGFDTYLDSEAATIKTITLTSAIPLLFPASIIATATDQLGNTSEFSLSTVIGDE